ncbi:MAG: CARDB domain-containing protein [Flavobacteriales bacterium]
MIALIACNHTHGQLLIPFSDMPVAPFNNTNFVSKAIDFDNDGDDDAFGYTIGSNFSGRLFRNDGNMTFSDVTVASNFPLRPNGMAADLDKNGFMDIYHWVGDTIEFYLNLGGFFGSTNCSSFLLTETFSVAIQNVRGLRFSDYNADGVYDILLLENFSNVTRVWAKRGQLDCGGSSSYSLTPSAPELILELFDTTDPVFALADLNNDSSFDLLIGTGQGGPFGSGYNNYNYSVFLNDGNGAFQEFSNSGFNLGRSSAFGSLGEFNNDGLVDIFSGTADCCVGGTGGAGNINPLYVFTSNSPINYSSSTTSMLRATDRKYYNVGSVVDINLDRLQDVVWTDIYAYAFSSSALQCYINDSDGTFIEESVALGINAGTSPSPVLHCSQLSSTIDMNSDYKPDLHIMSFGTYDQTFYNNYTKINNSENNSVKLKLDACEGLREGWGARVRYKCNGTWSYQQHTGYSNSNYPYMYLGMSDAVMIDSLVVDWVGGATSTLTDVSAGNFITVTENVSCANYSAGSVLWVFNDINQDCIFQAGEVGVPGVTLEIQPMNQVFQTDNSGTVYLDSLASGEYTIVLNTGDNWSENCSSLLTFEISGSPEFIFVPIVSTNPCPSPNITITCPTMRRCSENAWPIYVYACNDNLGTGILENAYLQVELDESIIVDSATTPPYTMVDGLYQFDIGSLNPGQCASLTINANFSCDLELGETLCMEATLYPVPECNEVEVPGPGECTEPWDHSSLEVEGECDEDTGTITFTIENDGEAMVCESEVRVYVDGDLFATYYIQLGAESDTTFTFPTNGGTWILQADQHPLHPGNSHPNDHVEGCGDIEGEGDGDDDDEDGDSDDDDEWEPGLVDDLPCGDESPFVDQYCGQVVGSFDPNDKQGFPGGIGEANEILPNEQLQYLIRFQNTGTAPAYTVVIRDTLDTDLDIFSVTPGVSSHDYTFTMYGERVLQWTFNSIMLPDSFSNEEESHGFITYTVNQLPDLQDGTAINNSAAIYFDSNEPVITNTTLHTINRCLFSETQSTIDVTAVNEYVAPDGQLYDQSGTYTAVIDNDEGCDSTITINLTITVGVLELDNPGIRVFPIPASQTITAMWNGDATTFTITTPDGRLVRSGRIITGSNVIDISALASGTYVLKADDRVTRFVVK